MTSTLFVMCLKRWSLRLLSILLMWSGTEIHADEKNLYKGCLNSVTVGKEEKPVIPCDDTDPLNLANSADIHTVIKRMGLDPDKLHFKGCKNLRFSAAPDETAKNGEQRYLVTYPSETSDSYLAPITHELAHVLQMEIEVNSAEHLLKEYGSKRVELGADFLTGIVFSSSLENNDINEFQHNLMLIGLYREMEEDAHGSPAQRTAAFRFGYFLKNTEVKSNINMAFRYFLDNLYGQIDQF